MTNNLLANFSDIMAYAGYILLAILVLLVMITVHELGHYIAGKIFKFGITEFAIGFGPKIFSRQLKSGEQFSIRAFPVGGFCAFSGEDEESDDPKAFNNKKPWQRIIVLISGAFMNYILAVFLIALMFGIYGQASLMTGKVDVHPEYASEYSFSDKDVIIKANGKNVYMLTDLMNATENKNKDDLINFTVIRNREVKNIQVKLRSDTFYDNLEDVTKLYDAIGVHYEISESGEMTDSGMYSTGVRLGFFRTIGRSFDYSIKIAGMVFTVIGELITGALGLKSVGGTVTTLGITAEAIKIGGFRYLLNVASLIGVNLAVFNLLPFPALDGSRVVFTAIEGIRKKPINRKVEGVIHTVGLMLLLIFAVFVDLQQCF
ncbi:MAG: site-2 protease family protein [Clostridia bacterium]|nr:site-2 protease family protein [Clostridia bacterium]